MNFNVPQKGNTRFMYVAFRSQQSLVGIHPFFCNCWKEKSMLMPLDFSKKLPTGGYEVIEEEEGKIPMTCYRFDLKNSSTLLHIGTAGGWTKPSTGYTFQRINEKSKELVDFLKKNKPLSRFGKRGRFWFYDLLFIDVLAEDNAHGADLFKRMFQKKFS